MELSEYEAVKSAPDKQTLRSFGLMFGSIIAVLFGLLLPWLFDNPMARTPLLAGAVFILLALLLPATLRPVFVVWMKFGAVMGWINTRLILALVFYLIFFPVGLMMRLRGKDPLRLKFSEDGSYRVAKSARDKNHLERPY